jgi:hypothetical protein
MSEWILSTNLSAADLRAIMLALASLSLLVAGVFGVTRYRPLVRTGHCLRCGYRLQGLASGCCPECGLLVATMEARAASFARLRRRVATNGLVGGLVFSAAAALTAPVVSCAKSIAAAYMTDRQLFALAMKPTGADARTALEARGEAIAAGERKPDGSLPGVSEVTAEMRASSSSLTTLNPTSAQDLERFGKMLEDRESAIQSVPKVFGDRVRIARELILNGGRAYRGAVPTYEKEQILNALISDPAVSVAVADEEVVQALLRSTAKAIARKDGTIVEWMIESDETTSLVGYRVIPAMVVCSARMRCGGVGDIPVDVAVQPDSRAFYAISQLIVPESVCDEGEFILDFELTRVAIPGSSDPPSTFMAEVRVPFGPDSPRAPAK